MRSKQSIAIWHKRMEKLENQSKANDGVRAKKLRQRIQHEIELGYRNPDGSPKARLIKKIAPDTGAT
jgi:hypothetical protein